MSTEGTWRRRTRLAASGSATGVCRGSSDGQQQQQQQAQAGRATLKTDGGVHKTVYLRGAKVWADSIRVLVLVMVLGGWSSPKAQGFKFLLLCGGGAVRCS